MYRQNRGHWCRENDCVNPVELSRWGGGGGQGGGERESGVGEGWGSIERFSSPSSSLTHLVFCHVTCCL